MNNHTILNVRTGVMTKTEFQFLFRITQIKKFWNPYHKTKNT